MIITPHIKVIRNKEICLNIKQMLEDIKKAFPQENYLSISKRACVHIQTIQRWSSVGRADAIAAYRLLNSFKNEENIDTVLLKNATPALLKMQCQIIGWDKVINS